MILQDGSEQAHLQYLAATKGRRALWHATRNTASERTPASAISRAAPSMQKGLVARCWRVNGMWGAVLRLGLRTSAPAAKSAPPSASLATACWTQDGLCTSKVHGQTTCWSCCRICFRQLSGKGITYAWCLGGLLPLRGATKLRSSWASHCRAKTGEQV